MRAAVALAGRLPPRWAEGFGSAVGRLAWWLGWRRDVVEEQVAASFPERDDEWMRGVARGCFQHVGREAMVVARAARTGLPAVRRAIVSFEGEAELRRSFDAGCGIIMVTGHVGNWEIAGSTLRAFGYPVDGVMQGLTNPYLSRYVCQIRRRLGIRPIDRARAWGELRSSLANGRVVGFVADQDARAQGVFVPFFGRPASTHRAPATLALRTGAPLFVGGVYRQGPGRYRAWTTRLTPPDRGGLHHRVAVLTTKWVAELERRVRLSPEQYFWHHKRWKTRPWGTTPGIAGIKVGSERTT